MLVSRTMKILEGIVGSQPWLWRMRCSPPTSPLGQAPDWTV